ncbi:MAG: hypothetical protein M1840_002187 [Geoglossum simile]|nr:MAG: hypothetical protein M1840_002187 [Geoglossum simile]
MDDLRGSWVARFPIYRAMLPAILSPGNIRVVPPKLLLERFLATVRSECIIAREQMQSVFLLIFGHGTKSTYGIAIGGEGDVGNAPLLSINSLKQAVGSKVGVGMLLTSCYSGGWVIQPQLNVTTMTAAGPKKQSESWSKSESSGRASGSIYASAVIRALFKMEHPLATQFQDSPSSEFLQRPETSSSSAEFARIIYRTLLDDVDSLGQCHGIRFSAQDDTWEMEWRPRSGIPLNKFKERWEMLRSIPVDTADPRTNRTPHGEESRPLGDQAGIQLSEGLRGSMVIRGIDRVTQMMAYHYLNSFPGNYHHGGNYAHGRIRDFLAGKGSYGAESLHPILAYRLSSMELATDYKDYLSLTFPDCNSYDHEAWLGDLCLECRQQGPPGQAARERLRYYEDVQSRVGDSQIFDPALPDQGLSYSKPDNYLAVAMCSSNLSLLQVAEALAKLQTLKAVKMAKLFDKVERKRTLKMFFSNTFEKCSTLGKRFRSRSPEKGKSVGESSVSQSPSKRIR